MKVYAGILLAAALAGSAFGQGAPAPFALQQYFDNNGTPLSGGSLCSYSSGTSTPATTWSDAALTVPNSTCITLNSAGRPQSNGIFLGTTVYRFILKDSTGVTIWTQDGIAVASPLGAGAWSTSGTNIYNNISGSKVCIASSGNCTSPLSLLNVQGASSGANYLVRIDDSSNTPGVSLFGSGNAYGYYAADSGGLRLRDANAASQLTVTTGNVTVQNAAAAGSSSLTVEAGASQGSSNLLQLQDNTGTNLAWFDSAGRIASPVFNSTATGSSIAFQNSNSYFSVNGFGDLTANGQVNIIGTDDSVNGGGGVALKVGGTAVIDNARNATFATLTCTGSPCGSGGGGGGLPVSDATSIVYNASTPSKVLKFSAANISASTTRTATWPDANITVVGEENNETISGTKTFSAVVTGSAGFAGTVFNSTATGASYGYQLNNNNFFLDGKGNITTACASGCTAGTDGANAIFGGYVTAGTWFGLHTTSGTPSTTPGGGNSAITYKGGTSGLHIWLYDTVHSAWSDIDLGAVAGGITSINGQTGAAQTIAGTTNEIIATTGTNTVTLSTPQPIATTSAVTFGSVTTGSGGAFNSGSTGSSIAFQTSNFNFQVDGNGNVSAASQFNVTGGGTYKMGGTTIVDSGRNAYFQNVTINGSCLGSGCSGGGGGVTSAAGTTNQVYVNGGVGAQTGAITLSLPQPIGTTSTPTFTGVISNGAFNSTASGSSIAFQTSNSYFQVDGQGDVSAYNQFNVTSGSGTYKMGGSVVINGSRQFVGNGVDVAGNGVSAGNYNVYGGYIGQTWNIGFPSAFTINGSGSYTTLVFRGGILVSAF